MERIPEAVTSVPACRTARWFGAVFVDVAISVLTFSGTVWDTFFVLLPNTTMFQFFFPLRNFAHSPRTYFLSGALVYDQRNQWSSKIKWSRVGWQTKA